MKKFIQRLLPLAFLSLLCFASAAQGKNTEFSFKKEARPFKILTSGRQITIKSSKEISNIMVWTSSGHRIVEQTRVGAASFSFSVAQSKEKIFFVMVQYASGRPVTEKFGIE